MARLSAQLLQRPAGQSTARAAQIVPASYKRSHALSRQIDASDYPGTLISPSEHSRWRGVRFAWRPLRKTGARLHDGSAGGLPTGVGKAQLHSRKRIILPTHSPRRRPGMGPCPRRIWRFDHCGVKSLGLSGGCEETADSWCYAGPVAWVVALALRPVRLPASGRVAQLVEQVTLNH